MFRNRYKFLVITILVLLSFFRYDRAAYAAPAPPLPNVEVMVKIASHFRPGADIADAFTNLGIYDEKIDDPQCTIWIWESPRYAYEIAIAEISSEILGVSFIALVSTTPNKTEVNKLQNALFAHLKSTLGRGPTHIPGTNVHGWSFNDSAGIPFVFFVKGFDNAVQMVYCWQKDIDIFQLGPKR